MQIPKEIKLSDVLDEIARGSNLDQALHLIAQKATVDLKAQACKIWVVKHGDICERCPLAGICANRQMCLHLAATSGTSIEREYPRIPLSVLNTSLIVRGGISDFRESNGAGDKLFGLQKSAYTTGTPSYALYPLKGISGTVGLIGVFNDRLIDQDELQILAQLAPAAVAAIRVAELLARCDSLRYQLEKGAPEESPDQPLSDQTHRLTELEELNRDLQNEIGRLQSEHETLLREREHDKSLKEQENEQENERTERRLADLAAENESLKEQIERLSEVHLAAEAEAAEAVKKALAAADKERENSKARDKTAEINEADREKATKALTADLAKQAAELEARQEEIEALIKTRERLETQLSLLEETSAELRDYNTSLVENFENLENALRQAEEERDRADGERVKLESEIAELNEKIETLRSDSNRDDKTRERLESENVRLREAVELLRMQNNDLEEQTSRVADLEANLQNKRDVSGRLGELEQENAELREAKTRLEEENTELREANVQHEEATKHLETVVPRLEETLVNLRNRTELSERLCEEMEQRNRALSEDNRHLMMREQAESRLLANLSHELRTPMNSIIGFTSLLFDDDSLQLSEKQRHSLERIARNAREMTDFLNQVLHYSKIEAGRMDVYAEPVELSEVIDRMMGAAEGLKGNRPITIRTEIEEDLPPVRTDRTKLQQILLNLLSNAVKFTDQGTITIAASRAGHDHVRLSVSDTGIGIGETDLPKIFDEFRQAGARGPSASSAKAGVGLGLAITRRLVVLLEGEIIVSSRLGQGSVFVVTLPVEIESREAPSAEAEAQAIDPDRTALIIGRDASMLYLTRKYLVGAGYSVATTEDAARGLELVAMAKPSVIILDLDTTENIPEVVGQLAGRKDGGSLIASATEAGMGLRAVDAGADFFLRKPIEQSELLSALEPSAAAEKLPPYILVVDDNEDTLEIVKSMISSAGHEVRTATTGKEALEEVSRNRPTAIILDLMLPEMDGFEVTHRLRLNPVWRDIPVILLTARDLTNEERSALDTDAAHLLQKGSFSREDLLQEINSVIG